MAVKVGELYQELQLRDKDFRKGMNNAEKRTGKFSSMLGSIGKVAVAGAATAGAALAGAAAKGISKFSEFDKQMNEVFTLMPEASEEAQKKMSKDLRAFSNEMGVATDEAAPALYQAISAGVPKDNVFNFMEQAQKSATAGVTDLETSVDVLSSVVNTYGKENISAAEASDLMFTAVKQGKTTFEELSSNMSDVAPIASSMGVEFSNVTAALSTMTSQGTPTAKATTQLKQAMSELSKEGSKANKNFKKVAGESFQSFIDNGGNMQEAMEMMEKAAEENDTTVSNMFGSIEAGQAALALTGEGAKKFKEDLEEMKNSSGATDEAYKKMEESMSRNFERIKVAMNEVWLTIGEKLMPIMKDLTDWIIDNMPAIQNIVGKVFDGVVKAIETGIEIFKTIRDLTNTIFGSGGETSQDMQETKETFSEIFSAIEEIITVFVDWAEGFWDIFGDSILAIAETCLNNIKIVLDTVLDTIKNLISAFANVLTGDWEGLAKDLDNLWRDLWDGIKAIAENTWDNLLKQPIQNLITNMKEIWRGLISSMKQIGKDILQGLVDGIKGKIEDVKNSVRKVGEKVKDTFKGLLGIGSPSKVFMGYGADLMTGLAMGIEENANKVNTPLENLANDVEKWFKEMEDVATTKSDNMADGIVDFVDTVVTGEKDFAEAMKEMVLTAITALEKQVLAYQLAAEGIAAAMAVWDFGTALMRLANALPKIAATLAGFEAMKGVVRGMAEGAIVESPTMAMVGEGQYNEAVLPLNDMVFTKLGEGIIENIPTNETSNKATTQQIEINATYNVDSQQTAKQANDDLIHKLQGRGLAGAYR